MQSSLSTDRRSNVSYVAIESFRQSNVQVNNSTAVKLGDGGERMFITISNPVGSGGTIFIGAANVENSQSNNLGGLPLVEGKGVTIGAFENVGIFAIVEAGQGPFKIDIQEMK